MATYLLREALGQLTVTCFSVRGGCRVLASGDEGVPWLQELHKVSDGFFTAGTMIIPCRKKDSGVYGGIGSDQKLQLTGALHLHLLGYLLQENTRKTQPLPWEGRSKTKTTTNSPSLFFFFGELPPLQRERVQSILEREQAVRRPYHESAARTHPWRGGGRQQQPVYLLQPV